MLMYAQLHTHSGVLYLIFDAFIFITLQHSDHSLLSGALAENPRLLLLDELTTFLDVEDQFGVLDAVRNITQVKGDVTAIWVTHRFEELEYADMASYMVDGKIVSTCRPERMRAFLRTLGAPVPISYGPPTPQLAA